MAQQYQAHPALGQQHAQAQYVPQYNQQPNYQPTYAPHSMPLPLPSNARRFDLNNSHAPTPPPPLPFPGWDPAFLKQLTGHQTMPLPPPPPLPPSILNSTAGPPAFPHFPYHQIPLPGVSPFAPAVTLDNKPYSPQGLSPAVRSPFIRSQDDRALEHPQPTHHIGAIARQNPFAQVVTRNVVDALEATLDETSNTRSEHDTDATTRNVTGSTAREKGIEHRSDTPILNLRDQAKSALLQLKNGGITYDDLVKEGIAADTLHVFFKELGFDLPEPVELSQHTPLPPVVLETLKTKSVKKSEPAAPTMNTSQLGPTDMGLERKDRIARLLALRKGQGLASGRSSQVGSPVPQEQSTVVKTHHAEPREEPTAPTSEGPKPMQSSILTPETTLDKLKVAYAEQPHPESADLSRTSSAVPILNSNKQSRLADLPIPGLYMTSADDLEPDDSDERMDVATTDEVCTDLNSIFVQGTTPSAPSPLSSRKRSADNSDSVAPPQKRRVSSSLPLISQAVSDGAVVATQHDDPTPVDSTISIRPRINQSKLNERLAALKANLLQKNSQKKALQESVPTSAAEISKTKAGLAEQQERLAGVKLRVASLHADLQRATNEEQQISKEVQRLQEQLALGGVGQRRSSRELTGCNDQETERSLPGSRPGTAHRKADGYSKQQEAGSNQAYLSLSNASDGDDYTLKEVTAELGPDSSIRPVSVRRGSSAHDHAEAAVERRDIEQEDIDRQLNAEAAAMALHIENSLGAMEGEGLSEHKDDTSETSQRRSKSDNDTEEMQVSEADSGDDRMSIDGEDDIVRSDGSASMSDSGSEEYEPTSTLQPSEAVDEAQEEEEEEEYDPQELELLVAAEAEVSTRTDDGAAEVGQQESSIDLPGLSAARQTEMVLPTEEATPLVPATRGNMTEDISEAAVNPVLVTDEETADTNVDPKVVPHHTTASDVVDSTRSLHSTGGPSRFTPYQSPLLAFKSYRFHPDFRQTVDDGFRSLTYSNAIDPNRPLCPTELDGAECHDVDCQEQHFRSISLSGMSAQLSVY